MFLDDVVGPMSVKEAKRLSGADKFRKHISDIEKKYKPSEEHYNRLKSDPAYREKEFQKWQQEVHGDKAVDEDSWHAGDGGTWGQGDAWSSEQHEMVEGRLHVGDPIVVTAPNEFEGKTGEIAEFSPSGKFAIVDLYNYGRHSMHLSDVEYNQYADREDEGVEEGYQDFNKVEPYAVCLAGKPVKQFDYYEEARRYHDNWKKKLYKSGKPEDKAKADKITLMPIMKEMDKSQTPPGRYDDYPLGVKGTTVKPTTRKKVVKSLTKDLEKAFAKEKGVKEAGSPAQQAAIAINMKKHHKKPKTESDDFDDGDWADDPTAHAVTKSNQPSRYPEAVLRAIERNPAMRADIIADYNRKQQQSVAEAEGDPEGLPHLTKELLTHIVQQVGTEGAHAIIKSLEWGDGAAEELLALILKDLKADISDEEIAEHIGKVKGGYRLYSHKGKNLGTFGSKSAAEKHEREVQYFKHAGESVEEGHADQVKRVVKQGGKPVGEIGIDPEASPGNGPWYVKHYASGYDVVGFDTPEEALEELKYCLKQGVAEGKITLSTDPSYYGAIGLENYKATGPVVNIPANQLVGFEPDAKMNQPKSKANVEKIVAGLKQGAKLPPLLIRKYKNVYQVLDGHHRFWAYKLLGVKSIPAQIVPDSDIEEISKQGVAEAAKHGLYYNVNKRKAAGTSRPASSPKAPTAQAWKDAAKTAKKEAVEEEKKRALYHKTQDAPTKQAIDKAYRANPNAKNDTEALASLLSREIDSIEQEKELNQDQEQRIKDLDSVVSKMGGQAPAAAPTATAPSTPGPVSTPMPTARPVPTAPAPSSSNVIPMPGAKTPAMAKTTVAPTGVSIPTTAMPSAGVQRPATKSAAMPAVQPTAQPTAEPAKADQPTTSTAIGQMAKDLSRPSAATVQPDSGQAPFKGKGLAPSTAGILGIGGSPMASKVNQPSPADTTSTDQPADYDTKDVLPANVFNISSKKKEVPLKYRPVKKAGTGGRFAAMHEAETTSPAIAQMVNTLAPDAGAQRQFPAQSAIEQTIQQNAQAWANSYKGGRPASLSFGPAHVTLPADEIQSLHQYIMTHYKDPDDQGSVFRQILSDLNKLRIVRQTVASLQPVASLQQQLPLQQNEQQMTLGLSNPNAKDIHGLDSDIDQAGTKPNFDRTGKIVNKKPVTQQTMNRAYGQTAKQVRPAPALNPVKATIQYFNRKTDQYELRTAMFNSEAEAQQTAQRVAGHITSISPLMAESYWNKLQNERSKKLNRLVNELKESIK